MFNFTWKYKIILLRGCNVYRLSIIWKFQLHHILNIWCSWSFNQLACVEYCLNGVLTWISLVTNEQRRQWKPTPVLLPGKSHGQRSLVGCSPWGRWKSDMTERLHFHFSISCIGEGNGNPLQYSCLENPRDGRAWWTAVYGVAQSQTRLKRLSSSSEMGLPRWR